MRARLLDIFLLDLKEKAQDAGQKSRALDDDHFQDASPPLLEKCRRFCSAGRQDPQGDEKDRRQQHHQLEGKEKGEENARPKGDADDGQIGTGTGTAAAASAHLLLLLSTVM